MLNELIDICILTHKPILEIYNNPSMWNIENKNDNSPLTAADKVSNRIICENLSKLYPDIPIISEENKSIPYEVRKTYKQYWLIDPIDGTKEFLKRNGEFTVNVALIEDNKPVMGVVTIPCQDLVYYASKRNGAFKLDLKTSIVEQLYVNTKSNKDALRIVCSNSHMSDETRVYISKYDKYETVSVGSSIKFLLVAEGKADLYPRFAYTMEWDTGASQIIVEEAGGSIVTAENKAMQYNKENLLNPFFICSCKFV